MFRRGFDSLHSLQFCPCGGTEDTTGSEPVALYERESAILSKGTNSGCGATVAYLSRKHKTEVQLLPP